MFIVDVLLKHAKETPDKVYTSFNGREWTYGEFVGKAEKIAAYLQRQGYEKGDIIALYSMNSDLFLACYFGVKLGGFTVMPVNTKLAAREVEYIFNHSEAKALLFDKRLKDVIEKTTHPFKEKLSIGEGGDIDKLLGEETGAFEYPDFNGDDTAVVMYTSGTTGKPKGVMLTHQNIISTG
ncbi:AMP-binding protein [Sporosarcina thermotolerans]|uniref:AMP-binding protein n=1 Tax=Sporosarcina thermotolerans TaxID=633404 RepID=UPI00321A82EE